MSGHNTRWLSSSKVMCWGLDSSQELLFCTGSRYRCMCEWHWFGFPLAGSSGVVPASHNSVPTLLCHWLVLLELTFPKGMVAWWSPSCLCGVLTCIPKYLLVCQIDRFLENTPCTMVLNVYMLHSLMPVNPSTWKKQVYCKFKAILGYIARICLRKAETKQSFLTEAPA